MKIIVKSLQGDEYIIDLHNDQLVSDLKARISEKANGLSVEKQKLVFKGRTMQDRSTLGEYNLEDGCKVHLIVQRLDSTGKNSAPFDAPNTSSTSYHCPMDTTNRIQHDATNMNTTANKTKTNSPTTATNKSQSRFEVILRERLAKHFAPDAVEKIMVNLHHEINADISTSSLDDLERLAKQKLNISNE